MSSADETNDNVKEMLDDNSTESSDEESGGEEDTDSQADVAQALQHVVHHHGVEVVVLEGYGTHGQAAEEEHQVSNGNCLKLLKLYLLMK